VGLPPIGSVLASNYIDSGSENRPMFRGSVLRLVLALCACLPLAGVTVAFTESLYSYEPAGADGKQPPPRLLAQTSQSAISGANGLASIQPLQQAGVAGTVVLTASLGSRTVGTWTLLAEPTVAPTQSGPVPLRKFSPRQ